MAMSKSPFVLIFSVLLSFGLFCSAADNARWPQHEPREQYEQCLRRCEWETRGAREQQQCEQDCERQFRRQEERQHGLNSVDPSRKPEEQEQQRQLRQCQERCERQEQGPWEQQQCQRRCLQQYGRQEEERQHGRHGLNPEDPWRQPEQQRQLKQCQERCQRQEQGPQEKQQCQRQCQQKYGRQQREQPEERRRKFQECQERCQQEEPEQRQQEQCQRKCREQFEEQGRDADVDCQRPYYRKSRSEEEGEEEQEQGQESNNPFFFPSRRSFQTRIREEEGRFRVLQRFAEKSPVLSNINYFRLATFEANPHTFIIPHHSDSESIYVVTNGRGIITLVDQENKESYNVEPGTVLIVPAGCAVYLVNQDNNDKLRIAVLNLPLNNPGKFEEFFPATVEPPSYLQVFSDRILQAVFNTPRETLERVIQRQRGQEKQGRQQGMFRRIEPQQIRALSQQATSPRKGSEGRAINLMNQSPRYSNQFGRLQEVCPEQFEQLRNMNVLVSAVQLNEGAIFVPHYNSRATFVVLVTEGNARVEMACPHLSRQSQGSQNWEPEHEEEEEEEQSRLGEYRKITARLSPGDVFVVPAAHPVTFVAENEKLKAIGFGINAHNNKRIFVAGKNNLIRQMDSEAKEISFGAPARLIDEVFNKNPRESYFMPLSQRGSREDEDRRGSPLASFLDITRLF